MAALIVIRLGSRIEDITPLDHLHSKLPKDVHLGKFLLIAATLFSKYGRTMRVFRGLAVALTRSQRLLDTTQRRLSRGSVIARPMMCEASVAEAEAERPRDVPVRAGTPNRWVV